MQSIKVYVRLENCCSCILLLQNYTNLNKFFRGTGVCCAYWYQSRLRKASAEYCSRRAYETIAGGLEAIVSYIKTCSLSFGIFVTIHIFYLFFHLSYSLVQFNILQLEGSLIWPTMVTILASQKVKLHNVNNFVI